jgi:DNA-binding SARP family transcriptional activator
VSTLHPMPSDRHGRHRGVNEQQAQLKLFGEFALEVDGKAIELPTDARRLVAFLALDPHPLPKGYIAARLWPDCDQLQAMASLRRALNETREAVEGIVNASPDSVYLTDDVSVDVHAQLDLIHTLMDLAASLPAEDLDPEMLDQELLPSWRCEDWVLITRERLNQIRIQGLEAICERLLDAGRNAEAIEAGLAAVNAEPLRENAQRALISAYLAQGDSAQALGQYRQYRDLVREELGLEPTATIVRLIEGIQRG